MHIWMELIPRLSETNLYVLAVALITLLIALLFKKLLPNWSGMLVAMIGGSILALLLDGKNHGVQLFVNHQIPGTCNIGNFQVYPANP